MTDRRRAYIFAVLLIGCAYPLGNLDPGRAQSSDTDNSVTGRIILIDPKEPKPGLRVKQGPRLNPVDAVEGMLVRRGQLLYVDSNARATVICGDGTKHDLIPGPQGVPCKSPCSPDVCGIRLDGGTIRLTRGGDTANSPYPIIISPRRGLVLSTRPPIRWSPIAGAKADTAYTVRIFGENQRLIWSREVVAKTELAYPDDAPALEPGQVYIVVVSAELTSSDDEGVPDRGFTVLTRDEAQALGEKVRRIEALKLPEAQTQFLITNLYAATELYSEAIGLLERPGLINAPAATRLLGDLYLAVGLNREAETRYLRTLSLLPANELEERTLALSGLALAYQNLGAFDQAVARLSEAINAYESLEDMVMAEKLKEQMRRLKK